MKTYDLNDIYGSNLGDCIVNIERVDCVDKNAPVCVFGILDTEKGKNIADEMLEWIRPNYNVYIVKHDGKLFEYPALRFAQYLTEKENVPYVLYLHTKGAANTNRCQPRVRNVWKHEFSGDEKEKYIKEVKKNEPLVVAPFEGHESQTWFNGFFVNKLAFEKNGRVEPNENRYHFEKMFEPNKGLKVIGLLGSKLTAGKVINLLFRLSTT